MGIYRYLEAVHRLTGVSEVESFWLHSALLSVEVFCVAALMAWTFMRVSRYGESIETRAIRVLIAWALLAIYCFVLFTSLMLFFEHDQFRRNLNQGFAQTHARFGAALAFFLVGWSPVFYVHWRKVRMNPNGA